MEKKNRWITFSLHEKEIHAISISGYFHGEITETKGLLAYENGVSPDDIIVGVR